MGNHAEPTQHHSLYWSISRDISGRRVLQWYGPRLRQYYSSITEPCNTRVIARQQAFPFFLSGVQKSGPEPWDSRNYYDKMIDLTALVTTECFVDEGKIRGKPMLYFQSDATYLFPGLHVYFSTNPLASRAQP